MQAILGLGRVGATLALNLIKHDKIWGTTTSKSKLEEFNRLFPVYIWNTGLPIPHILPAAQYLVYTIPLSQTSPQDLIKINHPRFIYLSSTSVYGDFQGEVNEDDIPQPQTPNGRKQLEIEQTLIKHSPESIILRLGGLYSDQFHPGDYLSGRALSHPNAFVNLISIDLISEIILKIIQNNIHSEIFNVVCDEHPLKGIYYSKYCETKGIPSPVYSPNQENDNYKLVKNIKVKNKLNINHLPLKMI